MSSPDPERGEFGFGARVIRFFPLSLKNLRELAPELEKLRTVRLANAQDMFKPENMNGVVKIFLASARRGNPNVTEDDILEVVDTSNMTEITLYIMAQSGLKRATPPAPGEPEVPTSPQTGGESMQGSPEAPDGPSTP